MNDKELREEFIKKAQQGYFDKFINGRGEIDEVKSADYWLLKLKSAQQEVIEKAEDIVKKLGHDINDEFGFVKFISPSELLSALQALKQTNFDKFI